MRYLVFSDVHGNAEALDVVLAAGETLAVESYLFLGDLIGYGPSPLACIERLAGLHRQNRLAWVAGNHEFVLRGEIDIAGCSAEAAQTLEWTRRVLAGQPWVAEFLRSAPYTANVNEGIFLAHDSLAEPMCGAYHRSPQNARSELACLRYKGGRVCFYGHTHVLRAEVLPAGEDLTLVPVVAHDGDGRDPHPLVVKSGDLAWIGCGSVGLPKNPQRRSECLVLDDGDPAAWTIEKYEVAYPRDRVAEQTRQVLAGVCEPAVVERIARWF